MGDITRTNVPEKVVLSKSKNGYHPRYEVEVLFEKYPKQFALFVNGYRALLRTSINDPRSFYQIAGIHGLPYQPYNEERPWNSDIAGLRWGGYCHHGIITFPTWHRPYMLLIEKCVREFALGDFVERISDNATREEWRNEWTKFRFPYLDWATKGFVLPEFLLSKTIKTFSVVNGQVKENVDMPNPLRSYIFQTDVASVFQGEGLNPATPPFDPTRVDNLGGTPYCPKGYPTLRHPGVDANTQNCVLQGVVGVFNESVLRPGIWQVFQVNDYNKFSNHSSLLDGNEGKSYGLTSSIEVIHDAFHDAIGGPSGHMSYPSIAAFDPIFFLHHCNVDRQFALWQYAHPHSWMKPVKYQNGTFSISPGTIIDSETHLNPFLGEDEIPLNSNDVREFEDWGYTYPEIEYAKKSGWSPQTFLSYLLKTYHPTSMFDVRWYVSLEIEKHVLGGPFSVRVFLGLPTANNRTPINNRHYAGCVAVFARSVEYSEICVNCNNVRQISGDVDLTQAMERVGFNIFTEPSDTTKIVLESKKVTSDPDSPTFSTHAANLASNLTFVVVLRNGEEGPQSVIKKRTVIGAYCIPEDEPPFQSQIVQPNRTHSHLQNLCEVSF